MVSVLDLNKKISAMMEPSSYVSNMLLPERVNATRHQPLGPDCIISSKEIIDQTILTTVQYYWYISHEKGCVECVVKKSLTGEITTQDPKCVVTRKNRRFEAYCCTLCRQNFVTVVQALLHLKAVHRPSNKIVIQDKDVFHNIEKAMEVPPVPLPWHIAKKVVGEPGKLEEINNGEQPPTFVIPPGAIPIDQSALVEAGNVPTMQQQQAVVVNDLPRQPSPVNTNEKLTEKKTSSDTGEESNPMLGIIMALVKEFKKHITALSFNDVQHEVNITFVDETKVVAKAPDLFVESQDDENEDEADDDNSPLLFFVTEIEETKENQETDYVTLKANKPKLAIGLLKDALQRGLAVSSDNSSDERKSSVKAEVVGVADGNEQNSPLPSSIASGDLKTKSAGVRTTKSVRFVLGSPDSSDDEDPRTPTLSATGKESDEKKEKKTGEGTFDGLRNVVDDLITTASKGRLIPLPPTSPLTTSASHHPFISPTSLPLVGSSPALSNMVSFDGSSMLPRSSGTLTRNQSWTPSAAGTSFSVASIRRPYTARGFTYAEKIELMKQQNDYDAEFLNKHIRKTAASTKTTTSGPNNQTSPLEVAKRKVAEGLKKQRRGRKPGQGRKKHSHRESTSSDSDPVLTDPSSAEEGARLKESTKHRRHRNHSTDSDDSPPTLVGNAAMTGFHLLQSQLMGGSFPTTDYYGSGEWATAAMETLKNLQSTMESRAHDVSHESHAHDESVNMSHDDKLTNHVRSLSPQGEKNNEQKLVKGESLSDGDEYSSHPHLKVKLSSPRKRCKSNEMKSILDEGYVETKRAKRNDQEEKSDSSEKRKITSKPKYLNRGNLSGKYGVSPLLSETEQSKVKPVVGGATGDRKDQKPLPYELVRQKKAMGQKCSSDPALSSSARISSSSDPVLPRISEEPKRKERTPDSMDESFARSGDHLVFMKDVSYAETEEPVMLKLQQNTPSSSTLADNIDSNMPEVFRNCIDTYAKVQLIQKLHVCKVCGFSVPANDSPSPPSDSNNGEKLLRAHVMEHSLKELYETGYTIGQW